MVEYYTGRDASLMTDSELAMKIAHLNRIRKLEAEGSLDSLKSILNDR